MKSILITGGAGFIGSHLVRLMVNKYPQTKIINYDLLTYAGNLANLKDVENAPNYVFVKGDICDAALVAQTLEQYAVDGIIHLAAESHVDRSITDPLSFARTNVLGTLTLLQAAKTYWSQSRGGAAQPTAQADPRADGKASQKPTAQTSPRGASQASAQPTAQADPRAAMAGHLFYHVSTDEVYGSLSEPGTFFVESTHYDPHSPYSASKASSDHFVRAYRDTFGLPVKISNCSNNYGPYQFPEKLIPLFINNIRHGKPLPVYGKGENVRDWLYVEDHARAIDLIFHEGNLGETYNIGGFNEWKNIDLIKVMIRVADRLLGNAPGTSDKLITYVTDRPGHDVRYAIDSTKLKHQLGWEPSLQFEEGIEKTIRWYLENEDWLDNVTSGAYQQYYQKMYQNR